MVELFLEWDLSPSVATQACGIAGICKEAQNVVVEQHKPVCTNICLMWQTWACLSDETIKACWAQVMDGSQPLKCSKLSLLPFLQFYLITTSAQLQKE
jgi:hypothetical protein